MKDPSPFDFLFGPGPTGERGTLWPRWIFLRCLGLIFFSAFYSLAFQIHGLIGPQGILPAGSYLENVVRVLPGLSRFWYVPTLLWMGSGHAALTSLVWGGLIASVLLVLNVWPRAMIAVCFILFLSFISAAQDFASYQSDGMLLEAAFLSLFFAPRGLWPGLGVDQPPSRASLFLLRWEWFRIYFESGIVKILSGEEQWRNLTAMDRYYENGPLPTWIGWYTQQRLSHGFHAATALATLVVELVLVWMAWLPRKFQLACFAIVTPLQIGIILTANYAFLNYLVLVLGFLLLDDGVFARLGLRVPETSAVRAVPRWRMAAAAAVLAWILYATVAPYLTMTGTSFLAAPARLLDPFRIANQYGLFAVMTRARFEIEFQGSRDGNKWIAYPFRYKPQDPAEAPGLYAPYHPRFEWNLWFASLGSWGQYPWVVNAEARLLEGSPDVLRLFRRDPFAGSPPQRVRTVLWQYAFTTPAEKRAHRQLVAPQARHLLCPGGRAAAGRDDRGDGRGAIIETMETSAKSLSRRGFMGLLGTGAAAAALRPGLAVALEQAPPPAAGALVRLSSNENPYGPSPAAFDALREAFELAWRYPDEHADALVADLARLHGVTEDSILLGDGSSEVLKLAAAAFTAPGRPAVTADPTFEAVARYAAQGGAQAVKVPLASGFRHDLPAMLKAGAGGGLFYVCNPNNPTATVTPKGEVRDFLARIPAGATVLVDEAYFHYAESGDYESVIPLVADHPNLIVARTFSKIHGMAGLRLGYAVAQPGTVTRLRGQQAWDSVNILAIAAARASLKDTGHLERSRRLNRETRAWLRSELEGIGYSLLPSETNFVMVDLRRDVSPTIEALKERRVEVGRRFGTLPNFLRVTVGTRPQMEAFLGAFRQVMAPAG